MPTYRLSARNQFRSPSGAVGEAPDGPGALAALSDDLDNFLGIGGAEYASSQAAIANIPTSRRFLGKLVYAADSGTMFRYVGAGNTVPAQLAGQQTSAQWQAWNKAPTPFTPVWTNIGFTSPAVNLGMYGIAGGLLWVDAFIQASGASTPSTTADAILSLPTNGISFFGAGGGTWFSGGSAAVNSQHDLVTYVVGTVGTQSTTLRIRTRVASAVGASVKQNPYLGAYMTGAAGDQLMIHYRGPAGAVL